MTYAPMEKLVLADRQPACPSPKPRRALCCAPRDSPHHPIHEPARWLGWPKSVHHVLDALKAGSPFPEGRVGRQLLAQPLGLFL